VIFDGKESKVALLSDFWWKIMFFWSFNSFVLGCLWNTNVFFFVI